MNSKEALCNTYLLGIDPIPRKYRASAGINTAVTWIDLPSTTVTTLVHVFLSTLLGSTITPLTRWVFKTKQKGLLQMFSLIKDCLLKS